MIRRRGIWAGVIAALALGGVLVGLIGGAASASASASAAKRPHPFLGVVADVPSAHAHRRHAPMAHAASLPYGGGPVLHFNRTHLIFWVPSGSGMSFPAGYVSLAEGFMANVAAASHLPWNVYGLTGQYTDSSGPAVYDSTYAGAVIDTNHLPGNGCSEPLLTGPGWVVCVNDSQLQAELEHVIATHHLPTSSNDLYFLLTPDGLGDCQDSTSNSCALGGSAEGYCGYHTNTDSGIVYAVIPYNGVAGHCQSDNPRPNNNPVDPTLSTLSHEHNEMITDPFGTGYIDGQGNEDGDLCLTDFGNGTANYNQTVYHHHYYLQYEYSNFDGACMPSARADRVSFSAPRHIAARRQATFSAHGFAPQSSLVGFTWFFGAGPIGHGQRTSHTYLRPGRYRVVLRGRDAWGNWAFYARSVTVARH